MTVLALKAHLAINVHDVPASIEFYRKLFGAEPSKVRTGYAKFDLANPPLNFTLNQQPFNEAGALSHLGIQVRSTEDVLAMRKQWHQRGLITRDEMQTACCFARTRHGSSTPTATSGRSSSCCRTICPNTTMNVLQPRAALPPATQPIPHPRNHAPALRRPDR